MVRFSKGTGTKHKPVSYLDGSSKNKYACGHCNKDVRNGRGKYFYDQDADFYYHVECDKKEGFVPGKSYSGYGGLGVYGGWR